MSYDPRAWGAQCDVCPLRGQIVVPPDGPQTAPVVLVGEAPGSWEVKKGKPFIGPSGVKLDDLMWAVKQDPRADLYAEAHRKNVFVTNALLCRPENNGDNIKKRWDVNEYMARLRKDNATLKKIAKANNLPHKPVPSPFDCCKPRLMNELAVLEGAARARGAPNGVVVVPLGNWALQVLTETPEKKGKTGIMKYRGSVMRPPENSEGAAIEKAIQSAADSKHS